MSLCWVIGFVGFDGGGPAGNYVVYSVVYSVLNYVVNCVGKCTDGSFGRQTDK